MRKNQFGKQTKNRRAGTVRTRGERRTTAGQKRARGGGNAAGSYPSTTYRISARRKKQRRRRSLISVFGVLAVVVIFCTVLFVQISSSKQELAELAEQESELSEELDEQIALSEELAEQEIYVQTKQYVEDVARDLGLVYPDEVVFVPEDD